MGIPIVIGVTGHRALRTQDVSLLRTVIFDELEQLIETYANSSFLMLNSIASGADTLCAEVALSLSMRLVCPLPMSIDDYRKDFSKLDTSRFDALIRKAENVFVVPDMEAACRNLTRNDRYLLAGQYVAEHCHVLLALWDGSLPKPNGCGTAEIVDFVLQTNDEEGHGLSNSSNACAVLHILTPRTGSEDDRKPPEVRLLEKVPGCLKETLSYINSLNADSR